MNARIQRDHLGVSASRSRQQQPLLRNQQRPAQRPKDPPQQVDILSILITIIMNLIPLNQEIWSRDRVCKDFRGTLMALVWVR